MFDFQPGDRVRELHGSDEGTIKSVLKKGRLIVLWDDFGDETEVAEKEVVKIHEAEDVHFRKTLATSLPEPVQKEIPAARVAGAQFIALCLAGNVQEHELWLVNPVNYEITFNVFLRIRGKSVPFKSGKASPGQKVLLGKIGSTEFQFLSGLIFQALAWSDNGNFKPHPPVYLDLKLNSSMGREPIREIGKDGIRLDLIEPVAKPEVMLPVGAETKPEIPPDELDLHAEKLVEDPSKLNPSEILDLQVRTLKRYLDRAIQFNLKRVVIIHGVGTGALRLEVLRRLDEHEFVKDYNPANMLKYGSGATEVWLE